MHRLLFIYLFIMIIMMIINIRNIKVLTYLASFIINRITP